MSQFLAKCFFGIAIFSLVFINACKHPSDSPDLGSQDSYGDYFAPQLISHQVYADGRVLMAFDEPVQVLKDSLLLEGELSLVNSDDLSDEFQENFVLLMAAPSIPGKRYSMGLSVKDVNNNLLRIVLPFFGPNPNPALLIFNEVLTKVSSKNSDAVEFLVSRSGNIAGLSFFLGTPEDYDAHFIFPNMHVQAGDYLVLHLKPEGLAEELDETSSKSSSGGKNAHEGAWDFWLREGTGLPDASAVITLAETPLGPLMDAVFYSDKVTEEGKLYRSFGTSRMQRRAEFINEQKAWQIEAEIIVVEDAAYSKGLTGTRSLNRYPDANIAGKAAWYICESSGASLGLPNSSAVYEP